MAIRTMWCSGKIQMGQPNSGYPGQTDFHPNNTCLPTTMTKFIGRSPNTRVVAKAARRRREATSIGQLIAFRLGAEDAHYVAQELNQQFEILDILQLPNYRAYVRLIVDGAPSKPFSALTLAPAGR